MAPIYKSNKITIKNNTIMDDLSLGFNSDF